MRTGTARMCYFKIPAGHYCLNDVHKASGEDQKHRPKYWLENAHTQALVSEAEKGGFPPVSVNAERYGERPGFLGTYQTPRGNTYWCYSLPRRKTDILLTGYSVPLRAKVIDHCRELVRQNWRLSPLPANTYSAEMAGQVWTVKSMPELGRGILGAGPNTENHP